MKISKVINIFLFCFLLINPNFLAAQDLATKFNFDDDYQGEEIIDDTEKTVIYDPFEKVNRKIFAFNELLDKKVALPVVRQYRKRVPQTIRNSISNFINNLFAPFSTINSLLQGDSHNAMASFSSFMINSTIGIGGILDVAGSNKDIYYDKEDLGQTFGVYGIGSGPYLVLPILGPSNVRDFSGLAIERAASPIAFNVFKIGGERELIKDEIALALGIIKGIDMRENLIDVVDDMRRNSFDTYATMRSAYLQNRDSAINK